MYSTRIIRREKKNSVQEEARHKKKIVLSAKPSLRARVRVDEQKPTQVCVVKV